MLRNRKNTIQITNFSFIWWCFVLCIQCYQRVDAVQPFFNDDLMVVKGDSINSSEITLMLAERNVSKIYIYLTHTFYADNDLKLNGIRELQIFASTWNITQPVTFDISGSVGANQGLAINGAAGLNGNAGMDGGNFFGFANKTINGDYLTVISNGGNGGNGQNGAASDDVYVLLNVNEENGESGWFSNGDLHGYYKKYFDDRGYDTEVSEIEDYTSFYAVFKHDKKASFNVRLHPQKCCGTTGMGGAGGHGGRPGKYIFKHVGVSSSESTPKFSANVGSVGKPGKDANVCENLALDVRIDTELKKVVFIVLPLHHSFTSTFTILNHTKSVKCSLVYVRSNGTVGSSLSNESNGTESTTSSVIRYKTFLIENMKNASLSSMVLETYRVIDEHRGLNDDDNSLMGLLQEAYELEKNYFVLRKAINVAPLYQSLVDRVDRQKSKRPKKDRRDALTHIESILRNKLRDLRDDDLIVNLELYAEVSVSNIAMRNRSRSTIMNVNDEALRNGLIELQFVVNGNYMIDRYYYVIDAFKLTYFPFAADYLGEYLIPTVVTAYKDLDEITSSTSQNLDALRRSIKEIHWSNTQIVMKKVSIGNANPSDAFYIWKSSEIRGKVRRLLEGKTIKLSSKATPTRKKFNAIKFNTLDLVFRSADKTVNKELKNALLAFELSLNHTGRSEIRCNNDIYQLKSDSVFISASFERSELQVPSSRNMIYDMLRENTPILSPYTTWELQLEELNAGYRSFSDIAYYGQFDFDLELHGTGTYIQEDVSVCASENLAKSYTQIWRG